MTPAETLNTALEITIVLLAALNLYGAVLNLRARREAEERDDG